MQNENLENQNQNQTNDIKKNPSRDNRNINQGQNDEKKFDAENEQNRDVEIDPSEQLDRKEIDLDRSGVSTSKNEQTREFGGGRQSDEGRDSTQQAGSQNLQDSGQNQSSQNQTVNKNQGDSKLQ